MNTPIRKPAFHGTGGELFLIHLVNALLIVITLGIYWFWAKTKVRAYLYGQTEFDGDRFAYHGTGGELLRGWLKAVGLVFAVLVAGVLIQLLLGEIVGALFIYAALGLVVAPMAIVGARRYRLSRTSWRGVRFSFRASWKEFIPIFVPGVLLTVVTLGLYYPFFHVQVRRFLVDHSYFGNRPFSFDGDGRDIFGRHLLALLLFVPTLGFYWFWYTAFRNRYYWSHTSFGGARFESTVTGGALLGLFLTNALLLLVTLGIAFPWVQVRTIRFHADRLVLAGPAELEEVRQEALAATATGEGLADLMDVDLVGADFFGL
ncbi:MAG: hypothetical protein KatS3mg081_1769 [Gemmatimonadales bacterium]|nr:MAG: hypothetical protein KatS3mg081_1769 [Gemmatimonadales bacterium]